MVRPKGPTGHVGVTVLDTADLARQPEIRPAVTVDTNDVAYILYTSGSTGAPKGVMLTHGNALAFVSWAVREFALTRRDRLSSHAPLHFDLTVFDLFAAASVAAAVVLVPRDIAMFPAELAAFVREKNISVWYSVPSAVNMLASRGGQGPVQLPELRLVLFAGEVFPVKRLRHALAAFPGADFCNLYGPTETNVCTCYRVARPLEADNDADPYWAAHRRGRTVLPDRGWSAWPGSASGASYGSAARRSCAGIWTTRRTRRTC